jgi:hypothetical protein
MSRATVGPGPTAIAVQTVASCGIESMNPELDAPGLALADATGTITATGIQAALSSDHPYARPLGRLGRMVTTRYRALLAGLDCVPAEVHGQFIAAMVSGDLAGLETWLDLRHGLGSFARLFRAPAFDAVPELVR